MRSLKGWPLKDSLRSGPGQDARGVCDSDRMETAWSTSESRDNCLPPPGSLSGAGRSVCRCVSSGECPGPTPLVRGAARTLDTEVPQVFLSFSQPRPPPSEGMCWPGWLGAVPSVLRLWPPCSGKREGTVGAEPPRSFGGKRRRGLPRASARELVSEGTRKPVSCASLGGGVAESPGCPLPVSGWTALLAGTGRSC